MTPAQLAALKAYADNHRADLTATELAAARKALSAAGLVRDSGRGPMYVELTDAGRAAWVREVVLGKKLLANYGRQDICACQGGLCFNCQNGSHRRCVQVAWGGAPTVKCEGWITTRAGMVVTGSPDVWRAGTPCRWLCPCSCDPYAPELPPTGPVAPMQLDLFGELLAGAS